jgi:O-antigen/teichoic acid export membrane protein
MTPIAMLARPAARRTAVRLSADVIGRALQLVVLIALARTFDEGTFGTLMIGATAGLIVAQLADLGLSLIVGGDVARRAPGTDAALASAIRGKLVLSALGGVGLLALFPLLGATPAAAASALIAVALSLDTFVQFATMQLRAVFDFRLDWVTALVPRALTVAVVTPVAVTLGDPVAVGAAWMLAAAASAAVAISIVNQRLRPSAPSAAVLRDLLGRAWPIGASVVLSMLYTRVAIFLLQVLSSSEEVAEYAVALRFLEPMYVVPAAMTAVFYPVISRSLADAPRAAPGVLRRWTGAAGALGAAAYLGLAMLGAPLIVLLFGPGYAPSGELLRVLGLVLVPGFVSFLLNQALIARDQARYNLAVMAALLVISVVGNVIAITAFGTWGAAIVAVIVELVLVVALWLRVTRAIPRTAHA